MKKLLFLLIAFTSFITYSQIEIKGTVYEKNGPLEGTAVYFNNSMLGTTTNSNGEFSITVKEGNYELIVSYLGYQKIVYALNTSNYNKPLVFVLKENSNTLDEIIIKKTIYDDKWKRNLNKFTNEFIGTSSLSEDCKILNPKALHFNYDAKNKTLTAIARKPLEILHKGLGYKITYELEDFTMNKNMISYLGYSRYEELTGSKRKQRKWKANRLKSYNGSFIHFYKTLIQNNTYEKGYLIHLFKRIPNPERPSEKEIKKARELVKLNYSKIDFSKKIGLPKTALDSALLVLRKIKLPKFKDNIYNSEAPIDSILSVKNGVKYLDLNENVLVVYTNELEEKNYIRRTSRFGKLRKAHPQSSSIIPINNPTPIDKDGLLKLPLNVYYEGYWSYEKFANSLPLDYIPVGSSQ